MDDEKAPNSQLLEEVFNELETEECPKVSNHKKLGFLEDLINLDEKALSGNKSCKNTEEDLEDIDTSENLENLTSVIHEGLTDSSEDEDNKYFEEKKYSESGRQIKNLIKEKTTPKPEFVGVKTNEGWRKSEPLKEDLKKKLEKFIDVSDEKKLLSDPILGMNIINPLFSSASLKEKLIGRTSISVLKLKTFLETPASKDCDWITGGAIVNKSTRTSQKGNQYCLWHLSDLKGDIKTVCVFLFGSAYKEYWKTSLGSVVALLNPVVMVRMDRKDRSDVTLRVDNAQKILLMGTSRDYGLCKSMKKNGEKCLSVVNKSKCEYCVYHMKKEYNKACRRSDLQPPKIGRNLNDLRSKILGKSQGCYNGKIFQGVVGKKSTKQTEKDKRTLDLLSQKVPQTLSKSQKQRDSDIMERLGKNSQPHPTKSADTPTPAKPEPRVIDLGFTISKKDRNAAKANALKYIREHGPLKRISERAKRTPEQISSVKRKLEAEEENEMKKSKSSNDAVTDPSKEKLVKNGISEEFLKLMNSGTGNAEILKIAESVERDKYFDKLETREKIEEKMASTFKVECKAVRCLKCNYKSFSASELCKKEKHPLKVVNAVKRFWQCENCSARTVCLELIPLHSCKVCGSSKWKRSSMMPEKKDPNLTVDKLSIRGDEEKFVGAATKQANLNLLVPEEAT